MECCNCGRRTTYIYSAHTHCINLFTKCNMRRKSLFLVTQYRLFLYPFGCEQGVSCNDVSSRCHEPQRYISHTNPSPCSICSMRDWLPCIRQQHSQQPTMTAPHQFNSTSLNQQPHEKTSTTDFQTTPLTNSDIDSVIFKNNAEVLSLLATE